MVSAECEASLLRGLDRDVDVDKLRTIGRIVPDVVTTVKESRVYT